MKSIYVALLTAAALMGSVGYIYYNDHNSPPPAQTPKQQVKQTQPVQGIGVIDLDEVSKFLPNNGGHLSELIAQETRLRLELKDAMKPVIISTPKVDEKPFDESVWQKNAQAVISEAAEIEKRKKQAAEDYRKSTEAEYLKRRDEANNQFLNEILNIKLKLQNADNMRLTDEQIREFEDRLSEIQIERNELQRQLMEQWTQEIYKYAEEAVKEDAEKLRAQAQESMARVREETQRQQEAVQSRNKAIMEQAMQDSAARQDKRRQLMNQLQEVSSERQKLEDEINESIGDLAAKLAVIHKLQLVLMRSSQFGISNGFDELSNEDNSIKIFDGAATVDLTGELIKELQRK